MKQRNIINHVINAAVFIILEIAALYILRYNGPLQDTWFGTVGHNIMSNIWGWTDDISNYFSLDERNDSLARENVRLYAQTKKLEHIVQDRLGISMSDLDSLPEDFVYIPAQITKISSNTQHNYIILNKGSNDGIRKGSGIITIKGIIGVIDAVSGNVSYARSFMNHNTTISARLGHNGPAGSLIWDGKSSNKAILTEIPHHIPMTPGDTIFTSGFSDIFPPDIPLGTIESSCIVNGATHEAVIKLFEDYRALRHVIVVNNKNKEEISLLEKGQ